MNTERWPTFDQICGVVINAMNRALIPKMGMYVDQVPGYPVSMQDIRERSKIRLHVHVRDLSILIMRRHVCHRYSEYHIAPLKTAMIAAAAGICERTVEHGLSRASDLCETERDFDQLRAQCLSDLQAQEFTVCNIHKKVA